MLAKKHKLQYEDEVNFERLMTLKTAIELCLALGMNVIVLRKGYEVVGNLKPEWNIADWISQHEHVVSK